MRPAPWELLEMIEVIKMLSLSSRNFCRTFLIQESPKRADSRGPSSSPTAGSWGISLPFPDRNLSHSSQPVPHPVPKPGFQDDPGSLKREREHLMTGAPLFIFLGHESQLLL